MENENLLYLLKVNFNELAGLRELCEEDIQRSLSCLQKVTENLYEMKKPLNKIESIIEKMEEIENGK